MLYVFCHCSRANGYYFIVLRIEPNSRTLLDFVTHQPCHLSFDPQKVKLNVLFNITDVHLFLKQIENLILVTNLQFLFCLGKVHQIGPAFHCNKCKYSSFSRMNFKVYKILRRTQFCDKLN